MKNLLWIFLLVAPLGAQINPTLVPVPTTASLPATCSGNQAWLVTFTTPPTLLGNIYTCQAGVPTLYANGGGGGVSSFNTRTGAVTLTAADVNGVGAITNSTTGNAATATALAGASALPNGTTATTQAAGDATTDAATDAFVAAATAVSATAPAWLQYLGTGADGAGNCNGSLAGEYYYTTFTVTLGNTCTATTGNPPGLGLVIHATGACTINGTLTANGEENGNEDVAWVAQGGGGGGGTGAGSGSGGIVWNANGQTTSAAGGTAGGGTGANGGTYPSSTSHLARSWLESAGRGWGGLYATGSAGGAGGSSGGAGGAGGTSIILICQSITGSGTISANGANGTNSAANNTGGGGGGAGGFAVLSSQTLETFSALTITAAGGSGGTCGAFTGCGAGGSGAAGVTATFSGW